MARLHTGGERPMHLEVVPSDREVKSTIVSRLNENPYTQGSRIKVAVRDGVVRLGGEVPSRLVKAVAAEDAQTVPGVADVANELVIAA
jgi:osmotically-inducible protein OsmY